MNKYFDQKQMIIGFSMILIMFFACALNTILGYTFSAVCFWIIGTIYSIKDIKNRFTLLSFNIGFFLFLMGGYIIHWLREHNWDYFPNNTISVVHTTKCLAISLLSVTIASVYFRKTLKVKNDNEKSADENNYLYILPIIEIVLIVSFICEMIVEIRTTQLIKSTSYANSMSINTGLPGIITSLASYYYISLFLFWAFFPSKRNTLLSFFSLALVETVILISGERGEPISLAFTIVFYIFIRQRRGINDIVIPKKIVFSFILIVPLLISSLQALSYSRVKREYNVTVMESIDDFFFVQGGSVKIIAEGYDLYDTISSMGGHSFVLGTVRSYFKNNIFSRIIFGKAKRARTIEDAFSGDSYLASYGYAHASYTYSKGVGGGSTYIAEVYQDGGIPFLIAFNIFLAWLISYIDTNKSKSIFSIAITLNIFRYMNLLPRGIALQWLASTFAIQNLILFGVLIFIIQNRPKSNTILDET